MINLLTAIFCGFLGGLLFRSVIYYLTNRANKNKDEDMFLIRSISTLDGDKVIEAEMFRICLNCGSMITLDDKEQKGKKDEAN